MDTFEVLQRVLRAPASLMDEAPDRVVGPLLAVTAGSAVLFGAVVGTSHGGLQVAYAALKMPAVFLVPVLVVGPLFAAQDDRGDALRAGLGLLVATARTAVVAAGAAPIMWLATSSFGYHDQVLTLAVVLALSALPGLLAYLRCVPSARLVGSLVSLALLGLVTAQTGWLLRPFVARPAGEVTFLRPVEASVFSSLEASSQAAGGEYQEWEPQRAGFLGRRAVEGQ